MKFTDLLLLLFMTIAPCLAFLTAILTHRKIHNQTLKKKRKWLLIIFCTVFIFILLLVIVFGFALYSTWAGVMEFGKHLIKTCGIMMATFTVIFLYAYFRKDKNSTNQKV